MSKRPGDDLPNPSNKVRKNIVALYSNQLQDYSPEQRNFFQKFYEFYSTFWPMPNFPQRDYLETTEEFRLASQTFAKEYEDWIFDNFRGLIKKDGSNYNLPYFKDILNPNFPPWRMRASFQRPKSDMAPPLYPQGTYIIIQELIIGFGGMNFGEAWKQWLSSAHTYLAGLDSSMETLMQKYMKDINPIPKNKYYDNVFPVGPWGSNGTLRYAVPHEWQDRNLILFKSTDEFDYYSYLGFPDFRGVWTGNSKYLKALPRPELMQYPTQKLKSVLKTYFPFADQTQKILSSRAIGKSELIESDNPRVKSILENVFPMVKGIRNELVTYMKENAEDVLLFYGIHPDYQVIEDNIYFDTNHIIVFDLLFQYFINTPPYSVWNSYPPMQGEPIELFGLPPSLDLINSDEVKRIFQIDLWKNIITIYGKSNSLNPKDAADIYKKINFWPLLVQSSSSMDIFSYDWLQHNNYMIGKFYQSTLTKIEGENTTLSFPNIELVYTQANITVWTNLESQFYFLKLMASKLVEQMGRKDSQGKYIYPGLLSEFYTGTHLSEFAEEQFKDIIAAFPQSKRHYSDAMWDLRKSWKNDYEGIIDLDIFRNIWTEKIPRIKVPEDYDRTKHPPSEWPIEVFEDAVYNFMARYPILRPVREGLIEQIKQFFFNPEDAFKIGLDVQWQVYLVWVETNIETKEIHPVGEPILDPVTKVASLDKQGHPIENTYADLGFLKTDERTVGFWKLIFPIAGFVLFGSSWKAYLLGTISLLFKAVLEALKTIYNAVAPALPYLLGIGAVLLVGFLGYDFLRTKVEESAKNNTSASRG